MEGLIRMDTMTLLHRFSEEHPELTIKIFMLRRRQMRIQFVKVKQILYEIVVSSKIGYEEMETELNRFLDFYEQRKFA